MHYISLHTRLLDITSTLTILPRMHYHQIILVPCFQATPSSQGDRHWGWKVNQPAAQRIPPVHCQALEGQYGSVEAGNLSWDLSDRRLVARCHQVSSFSFIYCTRKLCHSMTLAFSIIFPWCQSVNFCGMHLNLEGLTSTPLRVFCMPFRAMELWTFKPSSMKWCEAGCLQLGVWTMNPSHDLGFFGTIFVLFVGKSPLIWVSQSTLKW